MNTGARTFIICSLTMALLLFLYGLPAISVGGVELRSVDILADVSPTKKTAHQSSVLPTPAAPKLEVKNQSGHKVNFKEIWPKGVVPIIDYSGGKAGGMASFYEQLSRANNSDRPVRIAYFSDSFTENNIFTADLRELFQQRHGGMGPGWIDAANPINHNDPIYKLSYSGLKEYTVAHKPYDKSRLGIAQRYYVSYGSGSIKVEGSDFRQHSSSWQTSTAYILQGGAVKALTGAHGDTIREASFRLPAGTVYGVALEGRHGVTLDNFSLRGTPGHLMGQIPLKTLQGFAAVRPYDLIVIHYGLNVAIKGNPAPVMQKYVDDMGKAVAHLRQAYPETSVLVVSVSDRDQRSARGIETLKEVEQLAAMQQKMAADQQVAFLSLLRIMSGKESMKKLVDSHLANKDYTHLSYGGGKRVAQKMFRSFEAGYKNHQRRKQIEQQ